MRVISKTVLMETAKHTRNAALVKKVELWCALIERQQFDSFPQLRRQYSDVDHIGERLVFNLGSYRLIVGFNFHSQRLFFKGLLTHAEYDRGGWQR